MTPAPPEIHSASGPVIPGWGGGDDGPSTSRRKRSREGETEPARFIDFRLLQARKRAQTGRFGSTIYHRQSLDTDDSRPPKKMATHRPAIGSAFSRHIMTAVGIELERTSLHVKVRSRSVMPSSRPPARTGARKMPHATPSSSSDDEDEPISEEDELESSESEQAVSKMHKHRAAHKRASRYQLPSPTSSEKGSGDEQDEDEGNENQEKGNKEQLPSPMLISTKRRANERITSPPSVEAEPQIQLFRAFHRHTDAPLFLQDENRLPFLLRNLRKGFRILCHNLKIPSIPPSKSNDQGLVLVRYEHVANAWFERTLPKWFCPLCDLFGRFETKEMLKVHLGLNHKDVFFEWSQPGTENLRERVSWKLLVLMPETDEGVLDLDNLSVQQEKIPPPQPARTEPPSPPTGTQTRCSSITIDESESEPSSTSSQSLPLLSPLPPSDNPYSPFPPDEPKPTSALPVPIHVQKKPRPAQYPRPPPSSHRLGPAARKPYLPAKSSFGGPDMDYSTRIGGPYLFDLLQLLPLEPYGLLDWLVLEREAEIFNDDELGDELKVIVALWARWMMLNRNTFVKDRVEGVRQFIEEYWRMIHLAAGWEALVYQILVLVAYRLIGQSEVIPLILYYEKFVGMDYWDEWDPNEE